MARIHHSIYFPSQRRCALRVFYVWADGREKDWQREMAGRVRESEEEIMIISRLCTHFCLLFVALAVSLAGRKLTFN